jgi:hypothetical protein
MDKNVRFSVISGDKVVLQNARKTELARMDRNIALALADEINAKLGNIAIKSKKGND